MNKIIRSKASGQYGKLTKIVGENVYLQFLKNEDAEPIKVNIRKALSRIKCDKDVETEIKNRIEELDNVCAREEC